LRGSEKVLMDRERKKKCAIEIIEREKPGKLMQMTAIRALEKSYRGALKR